MKQVFAIDALVDPQVLLRVLGLFAQRHIVPDRVTSESAGGLLHIMVEFVSPETGAAEQILAKLQSGVMIVAARRCAPDEPAELTGANMALRTAA